MRPGAEGPEAAPAQLEPVRMGPAGAVKARAVVAITTNKMAVARGLSMAQAAAHIAAAVDTAADAAAAGAGAKPTQIEFPRDVLAQD